MPDSETALLDVNIGVMFLFLAGVVFLIIVVAVMIWIVASRNTPPCPKCRSVYLQHENDRPENWICNDCGATFSQDTNQPSNK